MIVYLILGDVCSNQELSKDRERSTGVSQDWHSVLHLSRLIILLRVAPPEEAQADPTEV